MLLVDCDSLPATQADAFALMETGRAQGSLIAMKDLAMLVGKTHKTTFKDMVQAWTGPPPCAWQRLSAVNSLADELQRRVQQQPTASDLCLIYAHCPIVVAVSSYG